MVNIYKFVESHQLYSDINLFKKSFMSSNNSKCEGPVIIALSESEGYKNFFHLFK